MPGPFTPRDLKVLKYAGIFIAVGFVLIMVINPAQQPAASTARTYPTYSSAYPTGSPSAAAPAPTSAAPAADGEVVTVTRVIDGDTIEVSGDRRVRVLGIDSCEASTPGGRDATEYARSTFDNPYNAPLTLLREPGVDQDRNGRELRYVHLAGVDYGELAVVYDHTGVYEGRNDASPEYVARLRAADAGGRDCSGPPSTPPQSDPDVYVDGSDDDGESRFCRRRWYC